MEKQLNEWIESMELKGDFEHKLVRLLFRHYLKLGYSIQESQIFTEMDYIEYKQFPAKFLLNRINVKQNFTAAEPMEEENNG